jgi:hypothetical protein
MQKANEFSDWRIRLFDSLLFDFRRVFDALMQRSTDIQKMCEESKAPLCHKREVSQLI